MTCEEAPTKSRTAAMTQTDMTVQRGVWCIHPITPWIVPSAGAVRQAASLRKQMRCSPVDDPADDRVEAGSPSDGLADVATVRGTPRSCWPPPDRAVRQAAHPRALRTVRGVSAAGLRDVRFIAQREPPRRASRTVPLTCDSEPCPIATEDRLRRSGMP
ncbi:hypothetical protein Shyd_87040 [Streptomyces hydrogenans]|uniref:Uncharacterized protein n=1 Tax=Streptomyces hydrogenans TaxID=1873719 RepID=A0ABQ3PQN7_9ACTN|nr:hypothetical protein GCM10018784_07320 [Streptomyces hydrogenans]GHI27333.1 hypothetical protein Shyd_87040 [Streptomyces hydrogenans]